MERKIKDWCEYCRGEYPIYTCKIKGNLATEYEVLNHCSTKGKECYRKQQVLKLKNK